MMQALADFNSMLRAMRGTSGEETLRAEPAPHAEFPVAEYASRYARARRLMEEAELDALLLTHELNVRYFSGYLTILWESRFRSLMLLLPRDVSLGPTLIVPGQETGNAMGTSWVPDRVIYPDQENAVPHTVKALQDKGLATGRIGMELGFGQRLGMTQEDYAALHSALPEAQIESATELIQAVRMIKSPSEVERVRRACEISQSAVREGFSALRAGMTEKELGAVLGAAMYREGAELSSRPSFLTVSSYPGRPLMVNSLASDYAIQAGDMVMLDGGATHGGYATDFIRQACLGDPTDDQRRWFDICIEANDACIAAVSPGVTGADVYEAGLAVFERYGLAKYNLINIVGHGTGMEVHELPWLGERDIVYSSDTRLEPGMVLCVEPVIAGMDGPNARAGIFIVEDKLLVTENGCEVLTKSISKDLWVQRT
jgi:Xaa-Pro aminopeptidase